MRKVSQRRPNETLPAQLLSFGWLDADLLSKDMPDEKKQAFIMQIPASAGLGKAKEIVDAAFISGVPMARYITGHTLNVKGGFYMGCVIGRGVQSSAFPRRTKSD